MTDEPTADKPANLISFDTALQEGELHEVDKQLAEQARTGEGLIQITPEEFLKLAEQAQETYKAFQTIFETMNQEWATIIRSLRVDRNYSWRAIADFVSDASGGDWGSNQLAGMALCERAAQLHGENYMEEPWNDDTSQILSKVLPKDDDA